MTEFPVGTEDSFVVVTVGGFVVGAVAAYRWLTR